MQVQSTAGHRDRHSKNCLQKQRKIQYNGRKRARKQPAADRQLRRDKKQGRRKKQY